MEPAPGDNLVRAAGAILVDGERVALVHRPRYDDWTLPKGKHEPGEDDIAAALREVREETGFHGRIERDLGSSATRSRSTAPSCPRSCGTT